MITINGPTTYQGRTWGVHAKAYTGLTDRDKMTKILKTKFLNSFLYTNCCILIQMSLKFVSKSPMNNKPAWVQIMDLCQIGLEPVMAYLLKRISINRLRRYTAGHWGYRLTGIVMQHNSDVIMGAMASQITSVTIVYSTVYSGTDQRKHQNSASLVFVTGEFPAQMASNAENVSIWWRHHET